MRKVGLRILYMLLVSSDRRINNFKQSPHTQMSSLLKLLLFAAKTRSTLHANEGEERLREVKRMPFLPVCTDDWISLSK
jgi:hypothetical protein